MAPTASAHAREFRPVLLALSAIGIVLLGLLTLSPNGATRVLAWPWWAAWRVLLAVPPLLLVFDALAARQHTPRLSPVFITLVVAGAGFQLLAAIASAHPHESLETAFTAVSAACLVLLLAGRSTRANIVIARALGVAGALFALVSLGTWLVGFVIPTLSRLAALNAEAGAKIFPIAPDGFRNDRPLGHSNYTAGVAVLALPWLIALAWRARGAARVAWSGGALLTFVMLVTSGSRGALLGVAAGGAFAGFLAARSARWSWKKLAACACVGAVLLAALIFAIPRARQSVLDLAAGRGPNTGDVQRLSMMRVGGMMGRERWWIGQGPGLTPRLYPQFRHRVDGGVESALQLHSTPVQIWADTGLPGIVAAAGLLALALFAAARKRPSEEENPLGAQAHFIAATAGVSLTGYAAFALTDYQLDVPIFAAWVATNLALLAAPRATAETATRRKVWPVALGAVAVVGLVVVTIPSWRARSVFAEAVGELEEGGDIATFDQRVGEAAAKLPDNPHFFAGAAAAHLRLAATSADERERTTLLTTARPLFERALAIEPNLEFAHFNLGWLLLASEPAQAAAHFRAAQRLAPDRGGVYLGLALARLGTGDVARGIDALALEILSDPIFLTSPAWDAPALAPHRDAAVQRAHQIATEWSSRNSATGLGWTQILLSVWVGEMFAIDPLPTPSVLKDALTHAETRRALFARFFFVRTKRHASVAELDIVERLFDREGKNWRAWMQAPEGREPPFAIVKRNERPAYAMLAGNLDIPVPLDFYLVQENGIARLFFDFDFPPRGTLPDSLFNEYVATRDL